MQYPPETIDKVCEMLIEGASLRAISATPGMPDRVTLWRWGQGDDEIARRLRDCWEVGFICLAEDGFEEVRSLARQDPHAARAVLENLKWHVGSRSAAYRARPTIGVALNVDAGDAFDAVAAALERAAASISGGRSSTIEVAPDGEARPIDTPRRLADLAGDGGPGLGQDASRG